MKPFEVMQKHYQKRDLACREWKERGGKVVGYFCNSVPEELIIAAGFLPIRISGDPEENIKEITRYLPITEHYEGFVNTTLNMLITGKFDFIDYLVIPRARDTIATQYSHLCEIRDLDPSVNLPELYSFEFTHTQSYESSFYTIGRVHKLKKKLEGWSGKEISDRLLKEAINITNENRRLLNRLSAMRASEPSRVSGVEALQIIGSSFFMVKEDHNRLLDEFLKTAEEQPAGNGVRIFIESSPLDNLRFYELVESCGATIIAEDHCWGNRHTDDLIDTSIDPLEAIAYRYHYKSPCPYIYWPPDLRIKYCIKKVRESKPHGVIFHILEFDAGQTWDFIDQHKALMKDKIPYLPLTKQKYLLSDTKSLKKSIERFIDSIT